jgi:hypothetical protein
MMAQTQEKGEAAEELAIRGVSFLTEVGLMSGRSGARSSAASF